MIREFKPYPFQANRYEAKLPPLRDGTEHERHPVLIVGAGPVGYCAALGLARHGVRSVLIEADDSVCVGSRAICISRRSLEIIERLGALQGFLETGLAWTGGRSFYRNAEVLRFAMPQDENQKLPPMVNLAQYSIEHLLLQRAQALPDLIDIRWQSKVTALDVHADGVRLVVSTPLGEYRIDTDWLVAADGGRSSVRDAMGLALQGTSYEGRYVIVDIALQSERPTERLAYFDPPCNPGSTVLVHQQPRDVWRIDYQLREREDPDAAILPQNVLPRVASLLEMMGERAPWWPIWMGMYKANALTLERYRHGRVLFAGDAAHLLPIFGVRGANSGIDDADNLAWKLAFVVKGLAGEALLDSYSDERVAAANENLSYGMKSTEFMAPPSFAFELMRKAVLGLAVRHTQVRSLINPRQTSAIAYRESPLNAAEVPGEFDRGPAPGNVLPECPLTIVEGHVARAGYMTDLLGRCFTVLWFGDSEAVPDGLAALAQHRAQHGLELSVVRIIQRHESGQIGRWARDHTGRAWPMYGAHEGANGGALYLVRPDGHVLGRWRRPAAGLLEAVIGQVLNAGKV